MKCAHHTSTFFEIFPLTFSDRNGVMDFESIAEHAFQQLGISSSEACYSDSSRSDANIKKQRKSRSPRKHQQNGIQQQPRSAVQRKLNQSPHPDLDPQHGAKQSQEYPLQQQQIPIVPKNPLPLPPRQATPPIHKGYFSIQFLEASHRTAPNYMYYKQFRDGLKAVNQELQHLITCSGLQPGPSDNVAASKANKGDFPDMAIIVYLEEAKTPAEAEGTGSNQGKVSQAKQFLQSAPWRFHHSEELYDYYFRKTELPLVCVGESPSNMNQCVRVLRYVRAEHWKEMLAFYSLLIGSTPISEEPDFMVFKVEDIQSFELELSLKRLPENVVPRPVRKCVFTFRIKDIGYLAPLLPKPCVRVAQNCWKTQDLDNNEIHIEMDMAPPVKAPVLRRSRPLSKQRNQRRRRSCSRELDERSCSDSSSSTEHSSTPVPTPVPTATGSAFNPVPKPLNQLKTSSTVSDKLSPRVFSNQPQNSQYTDNASVAANFQATVQQDKTALNQSGYPAMQADVTRLPSDDLDDCEHQHTDSGFMEDRSDDSSDPPPRHYIHHTGTWPAARHRQHRHTTQQSQHAAFLAPHPTGQLYSTYRPPTPAPRQPLPNPALTCRVRGPEWMQQSKIGNHVNDANQQNAQHAERNRTIQPETQCNNTYNPNINNSIPCLEVHNNVPKQKIHSVPCREVRHNVYQPNPQDIHNGQQRHNFSSDEVKYYISSSEPVYANFGDANFGDTNFGDANFRTFCNQSQVEVDAARNKQAVDEVSVVINQSGRNGLGVRNLSASSLPLCQSSPKSLHESLEGTPPQLSIATQNDHKDLPGRGSIQQPRPSLPSYKEAVKALEAQRKKTSDSMESRAVEDRSQHHHQGHIQGHLQRPMEDHTQEYVQGRRQGHMQEQNSLPVADTMTTNVPFSTDFTGAIHYSQTLMQSTVSLDSLNKLNEDNAREGEPEEIPTEAPTLSKAVGEEQKPVSILVDRKNRNKSNNKKKRIFFSDKNEHFYFEPVECIEPLPELPTTGYAETSAQDNVTNDTGYVMDKQGKQNEDLENVVTQCSAKEQIEDVVNQQSRDNNYSLRNHHIPQSTASDYTGTSTQSQTTTPNQTQELSFFI